MKSSSKTIRLLLLLATALIIVCCKGSGAAGDNSNTANSSNPESATKPAESKSIEQTRASGSTPAKPEASILFIVDSSGSMKESVEGKTKMETAKEVLNELVGTLSPTTQTGLLAYGHRTKNDCKDTELLVPIAPLQSHVFRQKVQSLQPLGQTPISYSLKQSAEILKNQSGMKSIILISDGEETCKEDPCSVAAELKKADIDLKVHIIGFGIDKESAKKQLHCIADATGGTYKDAAIARELREVLETFTLEAEGNLPAPDKGRFVTIGLNSKGEPFPWCIEVFKAGTKERVHLDCKTPSADLPPGTYDVQYYNSTEITWTKKFNIEIKTGQVTRVQLDQAGRVLVKAVDQNGNPVDLTVKATPTRQDIQGVLFGTNKPQELLPDTFNLEGYNGPLGFTRQGVEIKSGQETVIEVTINK